MTTLTRASDSLQGAEEVLQEIANDVTLEWFTLSNEGPRQRAGQWMLSIGPLLYDTPFNFLHICLWETIIAIHPDTKGDDVRLEALFRSDAWQVATAVRHSTTWDEFESAVTGELDTPGRAAIIPIK